MNPNMKGRGSGSAVGRIQSILLSLSFFVICAFLVYSFDSAAKYMVQSEYEEYAADSIGEDMAEVVLEMQSFFEEKEPSKTKASSAAPSPLHLGVGEDFKVTLIADGEKRKFKVNSGTVGDILSKAGLKTEEFDLLSHKKTDALKPGMVIRLERVTFEVETRTVSTKYKTKKKKSGELYLGEMYLEKEGKQGEREDTYVKMLVDGEERDETLLFSRTVKEPVTETILVGTKKRVIKKDSVGASGSTGVRAISELPAKIRFELDENGKPTKYKQKIVGSATAYYGGGITSTGQYAMPGRVAVDPREIPYGSKMYIVSTDGRYIYGYCEASDTGGFIYNSSTVVDLYFNTYSECVGFGRRNVEIYVLE